MALLENPVFLSLSSFTQCRTKPDKWFIQFPVIHHISALLSYLCSIFKINVNILSVIIKLFFIAHDGEVIRNKPFQASLAQPCAQKHIAIPGALVPQPQPLADAPLPHHQLHHWAPAHLEGFPLTPGVYFWLTLCLLLPIRSIGLHHITAWAVLPHGTACDCFVLWWGMCELGSLIIKPDRRMPGSPLHPSINKVDLITCFVKPQVQPQY